MTWEVTFFDYGCEVGTFDFAIASAPSVGDILADDMGSVRILALHTCDAEACRADVEIEYLD